ncbi:MAG: pyrroloquinoline quinone-dependent dehydrogenase [Gemmatimonadales bacterium]
MRSRLLFIALLSAGCSTNQSRTAMPATGFAFDWPAYSHDREGTRYSAADQITPANVASLQVAWIFRTGDYTRGEAAARFESTPLLVDGTLFLSTPLGTVIALDPIHGTEIWRYDPRIDLTGDYGDFTNRGVATWVDTLAPATSNCRRRIFVAPIDARLIALDSKTGQRCFEVDLTKGLDNPPRYKGEYQVTSAPTVVGDMVVVGSSVADNQRVDAPSGTVRAFDARTGALNWKWDPIPRDSAHTGAANAWAPMSVDESRDLIFIPVGSASPDFYGGKRKGSNRHANSVVALRASTGQLVWAHQLVHHDLWDYDVASQPVLATVRGVPALIQATKMGHIFVLNRETGVPLFPIEERAVPQTDVTGEASWPTQPFPTKPAPLVPSRIASSDAWGITPKDRDWCRSRIQSLRSEGIFTPPSLRGTIVLPGNAGGSNWGGVALDPRRDVIIAPTNNIATVVTLIPRDRMGEARRTNRFSETSRQEGTEYGMKREPLITPEGVPCNPPPWGALTSVDLSTGDRRWQVPLGDSLGSPNLGGAMVTVSGLIFVSGTRDDKLYAYATQSGAKLWSATLPAGGHAMPMTYQAASGRQYVVISAGGHNALQTTPGDYVIAYALPGAPSLPAAPRVPMTGTFTGEMRIGRNRFATTMTFREEGSALSGRLEIKEPIITGPLTGSRVADSVTFSIAFQYPAKPCSGTMSGDGAFANRNTTVEGNITVRSNCGTQVEELGTFVLRPAR